ncbi:MAG: Rrf2 family transcriptional regulator [Acidobacteria bacterium]|nr:Rrf2 family transcriptional regulator [Acidobacteriota bacterium]MCL5287244.1 Rrf2 family transcriptional regulator [Acidobacteriota bacterium]
MLCLCSHASELAIRAAIHLAAQPPGKLSPVHEIAAGTGLPAAYLAKIMRMLIRAGLVRAFRGPGGGVELGRPAHDITLAALVHAVEGELPENTCVMGMGACSEVAPCPLHNQWAPLRAEFHRMLQETSLETLVQTDLARRAIVPVLPPTEANTKRSALKA